MTKRLRRRDSKARPLAFRIVVASVGLALCNSCSSGTGTQSQPTPRDDCSPGLERCECLPSGGCDHDLECRSGLCVATGTNTNDSETTAAASFATEGATTANDSGADATMSVGSTSIPSDAAPSSSNTSETSSAPPTASETTTAASASEASATSAAPSSTNDSTSVEAPPDPFGDNDPHCGDGVRDEMEVCDDGNNENDDGCRSDCSAPERGYSCPQSGGQCLLLAVCGDAWLSPNEHCDDGNVVDGDGCSSRCAVEPGRRCSGAPSVCESNPCGDGIKAGVESCDDGNTQNGDGCDDACQVEPCDSTAVATCESVCGDGLVDAEMCDDGNRIDGDGCDDTCEVEPGFTCANPADTPSECSGLCGDAVVVFGEQCDDGINDGGYGECSPGCTVGQYCGDGIVAPDQEDCDVGSAADDACVNCLIVN